jgi:hypothetical protein
MSERPIFILGIQRGGTNQVLNILRSHPATFWPQGELHEVFRARGLRREGLAATLAKWRRYAPVRAGAGDILDPDREPAPGLLRGARGRALAAGLAASAAANRARVMAFKREMLEQGFYARLPEPDRMLVKVMNYNLGFAPELAALWPDAVFVGIVRDGRAVCEGHVARGAEPAAAAAAYDFVGRRLIEAEAAGLRLRTWRFEDLLADAAATARAIYGFCGLDPAATRGVSLQDKVRVTGAGGAVAAVRKTARFYGFEEMGAHMRADANEGALERLPAAARAVIEDRCGPVLAHFGYA